MEIAGLESAIIERLKEEITDLAVEAYPDNPETYKLLHPKGSILVHYSGSKFNPSLYEEVIVQERKVNFDIIVLTRSLRGNDGIYTTLDKIREILTGFTNQDLTKMYPVDEEFILEDKGIWQYGLRFESYTKNVEKGYEF